MNFTPDTPAGGNKVLDRRGGGKGCNKIFPVLLKHIEQQTDLSEVPGLYLRGQGLQAKRAFIRDLDRLSFPEPSLLLSENSENANYWLPFQTRRGCPLDCSYCSTATIEGHRIRQRSAAAVVRAAAPDPTGRAKGSSS